MNKYIYTKKDTTKLKRIVRYVGLSLSLLGFISFVYISFPLISWKFYFEPAFASNSIMAPIPKATVLSPGSIQSLLSSAVRSVNVDYTDAQNWFPKHQILPSLHQDQPVITMYNISIPKLKIQFANVSTIDTDLSKHLVHYPGTAIPPEKGNGVIFGHSTIPQWFNPTNYKTIFATAHTLTIGDKIIATVNTQEYTYTISSITITTPDDTSIFSQDTDGSYLTIVTCTPPGTTWKRLIIKARLNNNT